MVATTFHPRAENSLAVARPSPEELPVMKIVLPSLTACSFLIRPSFLRRLGLALPRRLNLRVKDQYRSV